MKLFSDTAHLDDESHQSLTKLIGIDPWRILTPCIQVAGAHFTSPSLSIECGPRTYSTIHCEWFESPYTLKDYWRLSIKEAASPAGIEVRSDGAIVAPCTINLFGATPIAAIEIHSSRWSFWDCDAEERIEWDSALLFRLRDHRRFCIWCQLDGPGIATEISFTESPQLIEEVLKDTTLRIRIE
jgi:hypothetical protein